VSFGEIQARRPRLSGRASGYLVSTHLIQTWARSVADRPPVRSRLNCCGSATSCVSRTLAGPSPLDPGAASLVPSSWCSASSRPLWAWARQVRSAAWWGSSSGPVSDCHGDSTGLLACPV